MEEKILKNIFSHKEKAFKGLIPDDSTQLGYKLLG